MVDHDVLTQKALRQIQLRRRYGGRWIYATVFWPVTITVGMFGSWALMSGVLIDPVMDAWMQINLTLYIVTIWLLALSFIVPLANGLVPGRLKAIRLVDPSAVEEAEEMEARWVQGILERKSRKRSDRQLARARKQASALRN